MAVIKQMFDLRSRIVTDDYVFFRHPSHRLSKTMHSTRQAGAAVGVWDGSMWVVEVGWIGGLVMADPPAPDAHRKTGADPGRRVRGSTTGTTPSATLRLGYDRSSLVKEDPQFILQCVMHDLLRWVTS